MIAGAAPDPSPRRYTVVAIALHWAMAAAIVFNIGLAWWMHAAIDAPQTAARAIIAYQVHKSLGLTILALALVRLAWRLLHPAPPLPPETAPWEAFAARATQALFYGIMIAAPLTGWLYVSAGWSVEADRPMSVPTLYFGAFRAPEIFGLAEAPHDLRRLVARYAMETHAALAFVMLGLLVLHVGAALKHWLLDRDEVLSRMAPGVPVLRDMAPSAPASLARRLGLGASAILGIASAAFIATQILQPIPEPVAAPPPPPPPLAEEAVTIPAEAPPPTAAPPPGATEPAIWNVDASQSSISFSGAHAGVPFEGRFTRWRAQIRFDSANLAASSARVTIQTASAVDGNPLHDETLPGPEWFDAARYPTAEFRSSSIRRAGEGRFIARGQLRIKDRTLPVTLPFELSIEGDRALMRGAFTLDRVSANLGMQSDPTAEYVSREIGVAVRVVARRAPSP